jgi:hypothetical protein
MLPFEHFYFTRQSSTPTNLKALLWHEQSPTSHKQWRNGAVPCLPNEDYTIYRMPIRDNDNDDDDCDNQDDGDENDNNDHNNNKAPTTIFPQEAHFDNGRCSLLLGCELWCH